MHFDNAYRDAKQDLTINSIVLPLCEQLASAQTTDGSQCTDSTDASTTRLYSWVMDGRCRPAQ